MQSLTDYTLDELLEAYQIEVRPQHYWKTEEKGEFGQPVYKGGELVWAANCVRIRQDHYGKTPREAVECLIKKLNA